MFELDCQLIDRIKGEGDPCDGTVRWDWVKSLWFSSMLAGWLSLGFFSFTWSAFGVFLGSSIVTLCGGHSLGMHRKLIHQSFECPVWLEKLGVYLGTLVGLGGPKTMMYTHDLRDWAQRNPQCHDYFGHRKPIFQDFFWQVHCRVSLWHAPDYSFPSALSEDRFYVWLQKTSMLQQLPWALLFFAIGGWVWVAWGVCARVTVSIFGHWLIGYFAHGNQATEIQIEGAAIQGRNVPFCGLITFGECWHNNHHAFPGSARIGLRPSEFDPGWWTLSFLQRTGLVWNARTPQDLAERANMSLVQH